MSIGFPTTAELLRKMSAGEEIFPSAVARPKIAPAPPVKLPPLKETPEYLAGVKFRKAAIGSVTRSVPMQASRGFAEGIWGVVKSLPPAIVTLHRGFEAVAQNPEVAGPALYSLLQEGTGWLNRELAPGSKLPSVARSQARAALESFEQNPGRATGRLLAEAIMILFPAKTLKAVKSIGTSAASRVGLAGKAASAAPGSAAVAVPTLAAAQPIAEVVPGTAARGQFKKIVEKATGELEAAAQKKAVKVAPAARPVTEAPPVVPVVPSTVVPAPTRLKQPGAVRKQPAAVPQAAQVPVVSSSVAPAPKVVAFEQVEIAPGQKGLVIPSEAKLVGPGIAPVPVAPGPIEEVVRQAKELRKVRAKKVTVLKPDAPVAESAGVRSMSETERVVAAHDLGYGSVAEANAAIAKRQAEQAVKAAAAKPVFKQLPAAAPQAVKVPQAVSVAPSVMPEGLEKVQALRKLGYKPDQIGKMSDEVADDVIARSIKAPKASRVKKVVVPAPAVVEPSLVPIASEALPVVPAPVRVRLRSDDEIIKSVKAKKQIAPAPVVEPSPAPIAEALPSVGAIAPGSPEARAAIERVKAAEAARARPSIAVPAPEIPGAQAAKKMAAPPAGETIERIGYDEATGSLTIKFRNEPMVRAWQNVPPETYRAITEAASPGTAFRELVKGKKEFAVTGEALATKVAADRVAGMIANAAPASEISKFLRSLGKDPAEFVASVREMYQIPKGPVEFGEWARTWRATGRKAVAEAPAVEVVPSVEAATVREGISPELVQEKALPRGMHVIDDEAEKLAGGKDFTVPPVEGASEAQRLSSHLSLSEMADRLSPGFGSNLERVRAIRDMTFAPIKIRLQAVGYKKIKGAADRNLYDATLGLDAPRSPAVARAVEEFYAIQKAAGDAGTAQLFRFAIDPGKVAKIKADDLARLWIKRGSDYETAVKATKQLKDLVDKGEGFSSFFKGDTFLAPPYEILRPMQHTLARYLEHGSQLAGVRQVFGSVEVLYRVAKMFKKNPDFKYFMTQLDRYMGKWEPMNLGARQGRDIGKLGNAISMSVLSFGTAVSQLSQVAIASLKLPTQDVAYGLLKMMNPSLSGWRGAKYVGATLTEARELSGILVAELDDATNIGRLAEWVGMKVTPLSVDLTTVRTVDNFSRGFSYWAKKHELERLLAAHLSGNVRATRRLIKNGFDADMLRPGGAGLGSLHDEVKILSKIYTDKYNLRSDILSSPAYLSAPENQFRRGLNMFMVNMTKLFYKEIIAPVYKRELRTLENLTDYVVSMSRLAGYGTTAGILINRTRNFINGREQPKTIAAELAGAWGALGALGVFDRTLDIMVDEGGNLVPFHEMPSRMVSAAGKQALSLYGGAGIPVAFRHLQSIVKGKPLEVVPGFGRLLQRGWEFLTE